MVLVFSALPTCFLLFHMLVTIGIRFHNYRFYLCPTSCKTICFRFSYVYLFYSNKPSTNRPFWDITLSVLLVSLTALFIFYFIAPQLAISSYRVLSVYVRVFNLICLLYISVHTLRSHLIAQNSKTILTPFGFIFLGISQYSLIIWATGDGGDLAFYGGLLLRWIGLALFLVNAYRSFL